VKVGEVVSIVNLVLVLFPALSYTIKRYDHVVVNSVHDVYGVSSIVAHEIPAAASENVNLTPVL
jgi:hypothetical protein